MNIMRLSVLSAAALFAASSSAASIYGGANIIQGYTLGIGHHFSDTFGLRAELNYLDYTRDVNIDDFDWDAALKNNSVGLLADYHPFDGLFRLTAGAAFGRYKLNAHGTAANGVFTINGTPYDATGEYVNGAVTSTAIRPYVGLGWGHRPRQGLGLAFDAGVYYGKLDYVITASPTLTNLAAADIAAEQRDGQETLDKYKLMPSVSLTLTYTF